jgi:hypothetical protein
MYNYYLDIRNNNNGFLLFSNCAAKVSWETQAPGLLFFNLAICSLFHPQTKIPICNIGNLQKYADKKLDSAC